MTTVDQLEGDRHPHRTVGSTGSARSLDALQFELHEGPCIDAVELDAVTSVRADDFAGEKDACIWPRLCQAIRGSGMRSSLSIAVPWRALHSGLQIEQRAMGSINFYAPEPHAFDQPETKAIFLGAWSGSIMSGRDLSALLESSSWPTPAGTPRRAEDRMVDHAPVADDHLARAGTRRPQELPECRRDHSAPDDGDNQELHTTARRVADTADQVAATLDQVANTRERLARTQYHDPFRLGDADADATRQSAQQARDLAETERNDSQLLREKWGLADRLRDQ